MRTVNRRRGNETILLLAALVTAASVLLSGCGSSSQTPAHESLPIPPPIADKPDVIITVDSAHHNCVAALYTEPQGSTVPCAELIPFIRDELRIPSGSIYDIHSVPAGDNTELTQVRASLTAGGYRFIGGHP
ncbi:MAG TPA: hypothetical protein VGN99_09085 [Steroidobacteraceae bacterium]|jgi:hypothetical protein|nr:hypothetical protein [Steroidobacteraceae bacterium]